jgi:anti-sigma regulatory factor (Ser/Thr protein kinase)
MVLSTWGADPWQVMLRSPSVSHHLRWPRQVSLAEARRLASSVCGARDPELLDAVLLIVSELVTNAAMHATAPVELEIEAADAEVRIVVRDADRALPRLVPEPGPHGGFGLRIVEAAAAAWGCSPTATGKAVWASVTATAA